VLRDEDAAEDAAQEATARAWRQRHALRSADSGAAWLRRIARNEALRMQARGAGGPREVPLPEAGAAEHPAADALDGLISRLTFEQLLSDLPPEDRRLVVLRYELDLAQDAIADALGVAEVTVRVRLHRIRRRIRPRLTGSQRQ
jgi:RNA polymerase sigma-70 factor (ECF subfamily)